jgi:hypothetical protein
METGRKISRCLSEMRKLYCCLDLILRGRPVVRRPVKGFLSNGTADSSRHFTSSLRHAASA